MHDQHVLTVELAHERVWQRAESRAMGSTVDLLVDGDAGLVPLAFARLHALEREWTRFDPGSALNTLHDHPGRWQRVGSDLFAALLWCRRLHAETDGVFDPTIRTALEHAGYDRTFRSIVDSDEHVEARPATVTFADVGLDRETQRVLVPHGARLDLGGIGKGLAADIVARELMAAGAVSVSISMGGDIHVLGEPAEHGSWPVPLVHPVTQQVFATHPLVSGGLAMSSIVARRWRRAERTMHHIIDPRTAAPAATDVVAAAVASRSTARAEVLAKTAIVLGSDSGAAMLRRANVDGWIVTADRVVVVEAGDS